MPKPIVLIFFLLIFLLSFSFPPQAQAGLISVKDFESCDMSGFFAHQNPCKAVSVNSGVSEGPPAPHPVRAGTCSMRCYVHRTESQYSYRADAQLAAEDESPPPWVALPGHEYWMGFSIYADSRNVIDPPEVNDILFQMKSEPWDCGCGSNFNLDLVGSNWLVKGRFYSEWRAPAEFDQWTDFVLHFKVSKSSDGFVQIWHNGDLIVDYKGQTLDSAAIGFKVDPGVYKWPWRPENNYQTNSVWRLFYFDEFRVGGANSNYNEVAPGGKPPSPQPSPTSTPTPKPSFFLNSGWNQITWPELSGYTAQLALTNIDADYGAGTAQVIARKNKDFWEEFIQNYGGLNFNLQTNQIYFLKVSKNCTWKL